MTLMSRPSDGQDDAGSVEGLADADVVESAVASEADASVVDAIVSDSVFGISAVAGCGLVAGV